MATTFESIYTIFLASVTSEEWEELSDDEIESDLRGLLMEAIPMFKFPRTSLTYSDDSFVNTLSNSEQQILASYMRCAWLRRLTESWQNMGPLYDERDFSPAKLIDSYNNKLQAERTHSKILESGYYRSVDGKPFAYSGLASKVE